VRHPGGKDYDKAVHYIKEKFKAQNQNVRKELYFHCTCATDTCTPPNELLGVVGVHI
jgi:hypothetical protein